MAESILEEIRDLLLPKENFSLVVSSTATDWTTNFSPPLYLDPKRKYEFALVNLETYNSIPNINSSNNTLIYTTNVRTDNIRWKTITIPVSSYELSQINTESSDS